MKRVIALSLSFSALVLCSGMKPIEGYEKTRWGMTPAEVQKLYPSAGGAEMLKGRLTIDDVQVAGLPAFKVFHFEPDDFSAADRKLVRVTVNIKREASSCRSYLRLEALLARKHGKPKAVKARGADLPLDCKRASSAAGEYRWVGKSTVIKLAAPYTQIQVDYYDRAYLKGLETKR
ncbi:MAG: hypothetical protein JXR96_15610 [Deltaproteobacteria bacterium]|nr:hypothetical protein [Deltaproteobacteria bacterium]